ncbi:hypothetical protein PQX77_008088 [Marasmius sp. AFHP31]|nr:hypothetical protein PQX77_008088 [Marasmius sp. AFHP31]
MSNSSNNAFATNGLEACAAVDDVRMTSPKHHFGLESLPQPIKDEIKRVLLRTFGPQFSMEDFFKSFELTLDGMQESLTQKAQKLEKKEQELQDKDQILSRGATHIYQLEQAMAALGRDLATALAEKQVLLIEKSHSDLCLRVYERLVLSLRKTIELGKKRIEELDAKAQVGGDVGDDTSVAQEIAKHSKGRIPPIESLMCRVCSMVAEPVCRDLENALSSPQQPSLNQSQATSDMDSPSGSSTIFVSDSDHESSRSRVPYRRMVSPVNHVRIAAAKMIHFGAGDSDRSSNWRARQA